LKDPEKYTALDFAKEENHLSETGSIYDGTHGRIIKLLEDAEAGSLKPEKTLERSTTAEKVPAPARAKVGSPASSKAKASPQQTRGAQMF